MRSTLVATAVAFCILGQREPARSGEVHEATVETYEHLAAAIIEIRKSEDSLVLGILAHHKNKAEAHLHEAMQADGSSDRVSHLENAATEISNIANEGDKRVQAVRQRLLKAGHHHHTDAETKEDYMFIDSKEKKSLLALAGRIGKLGADASNQQIRGAFNELKSMYDAAIVPD